VEAVAAAVGPGIGPCCYEVGDDVLAAFERLGLDVARGRMLDLRRAARLLLERAGVGSVQVSEECTSCQPELFFSHRRDGGLTGRQAGLVWASDEVAVQASEPAAPSAPKPAAPGGEAEEAAE
jgi:purine-nucleoside/S-methyl-5'-thioadenosine phosphorylase / adenosine deaminase